MRKRWNYTWIEETFYLPKVCSNCQRPMMEWDVCVFDIKNRFLIWDCCFYKENNWPEDGKYITIESYCNTQFKLFRDERSMDLYDKLLTKSQKWKI